MLDSDLIIKQLIVINCSKEVIIYGPNLIRFHRELIINKHSLVIAQNKLFILFE